MLVKEHEAMTCFKVKLDFHDYDLLEFEEYQHMRLNIDEHNNTRLFAKNNTMVFLSEKETLLEAKEKHWALQVILLCSGLSLSPFPSYYLSYSR